VDQRLNAESAVIRLTVEVPYFVLAGTTWIASAMT